MTRMLASVTSAEEARVALEGGADIIDLKDPSRGALGAVPPQAIRDVIDLVQGSVPVSAVTGDLPMEPDRVLAAATEALLAGATIIKIGIFPAGDPDACIRALSPLASRAQLVAVMFADQAPDLSLLPLLVEAGFAGAMLDTANKLSGRLLDRMDLPRLRQFTAACRANGLFAGLAGSLEPPDVPRLIVLQPAVLGFRGALCAGDRSGPIDLAAVRTIRALIPREHGGPEPTCRGELYRADQVFLRDWVLPVRIGAYARERTAPQRVRFNVQATVLRPATPTRDMSDVFSYDIISDGIRMLTEGQYIALVETLAERIAALILAHPRVAKVSVTVEKIDVGTGIVGVTIERQHDDPVPPVELLFGAPFQ
jgi:(5-formylfuran-3-yl)methyl phosphate synthase